MKLNVIPTFHWSCTQVLHTQPEPTQKQWSYTYVHHSSPFPHTGPPPGVTVTSVTSSQVVYETTAHGNATRIIATYEVIRFGVPMIGEYVNTGRGRRVTISPAVPGAQYRITAGELGDSTWSATPAVVNVTTREASELCRAFSNCKLYTTTEGNSELLKSLVNQNLSSVTSVQKHSISTTLLCTGTQLQWICGISVSTLRFLTISYNLSV